MKHHNYSSGTVYTLFIPALSSLVVFSNCKKAQESWLQSQDIDNAKESAWFNNGAL